jgi:hypothetical protein
MVEIKELKEKKEQENKLKQIEKDLKQDLLESKISNLKVNETRKSKPEFSNYKEEEEDDDEGTTRCNQDETG